MKLRRGPVQFRFNIDAYTPETIPMDRLAAYLHDLAIMLGERSGVHFSHLEAGSTQPVVNVDWEAVPKVRKRANDVRNNEGPEEARKAKANIERRLVEDNASAELLESSGERVLYFPGRKRVAQPEFGPVNQAGTLDGIPIVIGGESDPVPVHLQDRDVVHNCRASRIIAKRLGPFLFTAPVRVHGIGRWFREATGLWTMRQFTIEGFTELKIESVADAARRLQQMSARWKDLPNAATECLRHRMTAFFARTDAGTRSKPASEIRREVYDRILCGLRAEDDSVQLRAIIASVEEDRKNCA